MAEDRRKNADDPMALLQDAAARGDERAAAAALSALCERCSTAAGKKTLPPEAGKTAAALLKAADPKCRKNAARLLGALGDRAAVPALSEALQAEETLYAVPSMLLALGNLGGTEAREALGAYAVPAPRQPEDEKHLFEIAEAKKKALDRSAPKATAPYAEHLPRKVRLLLSAPAGLADILADEYTARGGKPLSVTAEGVWTAEENINSLYRLRCMKEIRIPAGTVPLNPVAIGEAFSKVLSELFEGIPYRIELQGYDPKTRGAMIRRIAAALGGNDHPSDHSIELRVVCKGPEAENSGRAAHAGRGDRTGTAAQPVTAAGPDRAELWVVPVKVKDQRFLYRREQLAASIHPVTAAALARKAYILMGRPDHTHNIYDPCCGSGTLLIESAGLFIPAEGQLNILGTDISERAVTAARTNAGLAHVKALFLQKDCRKTEARAPYDLVISNLPFGNRVGSHEDNEGLYKALLRKMETELAPEGLLLLYTMEGKLLTKCLSRCHKLALVESCTCEAGGLYPRAFFIRRVK